MSIWLCMLLAAVSAYLIGCFISGYYITMWVKHVDIRNYGSGNAGATNVIRTFGPKIGLPVWVCDAVKAVAAVFLGRFIGSFCDTAVIFNVPAGEMMGNIAAIFVIVGHNWPVFLKFHGGKGVSCTLGVLLACTPIQGVIMLAFALTVIFTSRYVSLGSMLGATGMFLTTLVRQCITGFDNWPLLALYGLLMVMVIYQHRENIKRLKAGTERKFYLKKKEEA